MSSLANYFTSIMEQDAQSAFEIADRVDKQGCFYCGGSIIIGENSLVWAGTTEIYLHISCAVELGTKLIVDAGTPGTKRAFDRSEV